MRNGAWAATSSAARCSTTGAIRGGTRWNTGPTATCSPRPTAPTSPPCKTCSASSGGPRHRQRWAEETSMKLATFDTGAGAQLGAVTGDRIVPLHGGAPGLPVDMIGLISAWPTAERDVRRVAEAGAGALPLGQVRLLAPIRRPGKI